MEFKPEEWQMLKERCEEKGVEFLASPFSNAAVDLLEKVGVKRYKIGSGEVNNFLLLEKIAQTGKPVILSSGMSSFEELDQTVAFLKKRKVDYSILQCTTAYPTEPENYGLNVIGELMAPLWCGGRLFRSFCKNRNLYCRSCFGCGDPGIPCCF